MIYYSQTSGQFTGAITIVGCYAGKGAYKNLPTAQFIKNCGPLPQGQYTISPLHTIPHLGPAMALSPAPTNNMEGRSGFFIHLDNPAHPGESSDGCIVLVNNDAMLGSIKQRHLETMRATGEDQLIVTA